MWRILKLLFTGSWHEHEWETVREFHIKDGDQLIGSVYHCRCKTCGKWRKFDLF